MNVEEVAKAVGEAEEEGMDGSAEIVTGGNGTSLSPASSSSSNIANKGCQLSSSTSHAISAVVHNDSPLGKHASWQGKYDVCLLIIH